MLYYLCLILSSFFLMASGQASSEVNEGDCQVCSAPDCLNSCQLCYLPFRLSASGYVGEGMGHDTRRASVGFFAAPQFSCSTWQPFLDVRGHYLSHNHWAANAGLGLRMLNCGRIWGANVYYDYRESRRGDFNQIGVGLEALGPCVDVRLNFYFPVGKKKHVHTVVFDDYIGPFKRVCRELEVAKRGVSAEFGLPLYRCGCVDLYGGIGPYYYHYRNHLHFWGGMARVAFRYTEYASIEAKVTYDKDFHTKAQGIFTLTLPFSLFECSCQPGDCLLWQPVVRNDVIILDRRCCGS